MVARMIDLLRLPAENAGPRIGVVWSATPL